MSRPSSLSDAEKQDQITQFIGSLREKTVALDHWAKHVEQAMTADGFKTYLEFRDLVIECESFNEIIQRRLHTTEKSTQDPHLQNQLDELSARQLTLAIHASLKFLRFVSDKDLPLGSKEVFIRELQDLHRMKQSFDKEGMRDKVDPEAISDQQKVEEILNVVIEKAPQLFRFDEKKASRR